MNYDKQLPGGVILKHCLDIGTESRSDFRFKVTRQAFNQITGCPTPEKSQYEEMDVKRLLLILRIPGVDI